MQYWQDVGDDKTQLIVISDEAVYAEKFDNAACGRHVEELTAGKSPATLFGKEATHIVLRSLSRVQQAQADDEIEFSFKEGKDDKTDSLTINDAGIRAQVFAALEQATHGRFQRYADQYSVARSAFGAALTLSILLFGTKLLAAGAAAIRNAGAIEFEGRKQGMKRLLAGILDLLGPTGVTVIGVMLIALTFCYLVIRIRTPPFMQILQGTPYKAQGKAMTTFKYLLLAAGWVLMFPILLR